MSGAKTVVALVDKNGAYIDALNPLPTAGGGGGGAVTQGAGSGVSTSPWSVRISNGTAFLDPLTDAQLRASAVPVSLASLPLPTGAATETTLSDIQTQQTDGSQRSRITDGTNDAAVSNTTPADTEYGLAVRPVFALPTVARRTYFTLDELTLKQIATASTTIKGRIIYNNGSSTVYIGLGSTAIDDGNPSGTSTLPLFPGQFYEFFPSAAGLAQWMGDVYAMADVGGSQLTITEIS